jgi:hypothetical protein
LRSLGVVIKMKLLTAFAVLVGSVGEFKVAKWLLEVDLVVEAEGGCCTGFKHSAFGLGSWHSESSSGGEPEDGNNRDLHCVWMSSLSSFEINVEAEMR